MFKKLLQRILAFKLNLGDMDNIFHNVLFFFKHNQIKQYLCS